MADASATQQLMVKRATIKTRLIIEANIGINEANHVRLLSPNSFHV